MWYNEFELADFIYLSEKSTSENLVWEIFSTSVSNDTLCAS